MSPARPHESAPERDGTAACHYVVITPAHNEEAMIERTLHGMLAQTRRPLRWFIVNDASTDRTAAIVDRYARENPFIVRIDVARDASRRNFARKVEAFNAGLREARRLPHAFIGNLDADISLPPTYYEDVLGRFAQEPSLGIAGGMVHTRIGDGFVSQRVALDSVAGAVQLFRRECFEETGGYVPLEDGGIDAVAEITARHLGWGVRTFPELRVLENRRTGTAQADPLRARAKEGRRMYSLGYGLPFFLARCVYRLADPPAVAGSFSALRGYLRARRENVPIVLAPPVLRYLRGEQSKKLLGLIARRNGSR